ncbi:MAG: T9SS type A sorting domain-containing protein [Bacteroidetes bacterium]|nr:T9SS type A sorting domain-containing protein [Bacteroidota bacterium]
MKNLFSALTFVVLLISVTTPVYSQFELKILTDKQEYAYGEEITIFCKVKNTSDSTISIWSGSYDSNHAGFIWNGFNSLDFGASLPTYLEIIFQPGNERVYKWIIDPRIYGLPKTNGLNKIVGFHTLFPGLSDTTFFQAPKYYGGVIHVGYYKSDSVAVDSLRQNFSITKLSSVSYDILNKISDEWDVAGHSLDSIRTVLNSTNLFNYVEYSPNVQYADVYVVGVEEMDIIENFKVSPPYPNPFNPSTNILYSLPSHADISFLIYNSNGEEVWSSSATNQTVGQHQITWNGTDQHGKHVSSGVYFYQLRVNPSSGTSTFFQRSGKMLLLK